MLYVTDFHTKSYCKGEQGIFHFFSLNDVKHFLRIYEFFYQKFNKSSSNVIDFEVWLKKLKKSDFRARFHLTEKDRAYITEKGIDTVKKHAEEFVRTRLAPAYPPNDGKQTPMRGHPVFVAQHACACCCRGCLEKWYRVPQGKELTKSQQEKIVNLLMAWITEEMKWLFKRAHLRVGSFVRYAGYNAEIALKIVRYRTWRDICFLLK